MEIFDFHRLYIKNNWDIQFVKHRFDVNTPTLNAFIFSRSKKATIFADMLWPQNMELKQKNSGLGEMDALDTPVG